MAVIRCGYNNIVLAAKRALDGGLERVLIVDFDVHHGNGTQEAFYDDDRVLFISIHRFYRYQNNLSRHRENISDTRVGGPGRISEMVTVTRWGRAGGVASMSTFR